MITIPRLRKRLNLRPEDEEDLAEIRDTVVSLWEGLTGRLWNRRAGHVQDFALHSCYLSLLSLELYPVESIASVEEKYDLPSATFEAVPGTDYLLSAPNVLTKLTGVPWKPIVRVTYTGGYTPEPTGVQVKTPFDVQEALVLQAQFMRQRMGADKIAIKSQNFEGGAGVYEEATYHPFFAKLAAQKARLP